MHFAKTKVSSGKIAVGDASSPAHTHAHTHTRTLIECTLDIRDFTLAAHNQLTISRATQRFYVSVSHLKISYFPLLIGKVMAVIYGGSTYASIKWHWLNLFRMQLSGWPCHDFANYLLVLAPETVFFKPSRDATIDSGNYVKISVPLRLIGGLHASSDLLFSIVISIWWSKGWWDFLHGSRFWGIKAVDHCKL